MNDFIVGRVRDTSYIFVGKKIGRCPLRIENWSAGNDGERWQGLDVGKPRLTPGLAYSFGVFVFGLAGYVKEFYFAGYFGAVNVAGFKASVYAFFRPDFTAPDIVAIFGLANDLGNLWQKAVVAGIVPFAIRSEPVFSGQTERAGRRSAGTSRRPTSSGNSARST